MGRNIGNKKPSVLILADFSDGSWHATSFAMQFLYQNESPIAVLQTYQKPNFGHFMVRNLIPHLKEITKHELKTLKTKLLANYKIEKESINTISLMGDLNVILHKKLAFNGTHNIVLGTYGSFTNSCTMQNHCLARIIDRSNNPLFILPRMFETKKNNKILFVGNPSKVPSLNIKSRVLKICRNPNSELDILFVVEKQDQKINDDVKLFIETHFKAINYDVKYVQNKSICKGIKKYLKENNNDLIIVERN